MGKIQTTENNLGFKNNIKWFVCIRGYLTPSGCNEIEAGFVRKADAEDYLRWTYGKNWRRMYFVARYIKDAE